MSKNIENEVSAHLLTERNCIKAHENLYIPIKRARTPLEMTNPATIPTHSHHEKEA